MISKIFKIGLSCMIVVSAAVGAGENDRLEARITKMERDLKLTERQVELLREIYKKSAVKRQEALAAAGDDESAVRDALAQNRRETNRDIRTILTPDQRRKFNEANGGRGGPEGRGDRRMEALKERLKLSPEQARQIEPILNENRAKFAEIRENNRGNRQAIRGEMRKIREAQDQKIMALLTDEQKKIYQQMKAERQQRRREFRNR